MKKRMMVCLLCISLLFLCACGPAAPVGDNQLQTKPDDGTEATTTEATQGTDEDVTQEPSTQPQDPTEEPTEEPTEKPTEPQNEGYLLRIERPDQSIYAGPGYDYAFAGTVEMKATYTIVAEQKDAYGILWGKLKSGAGWVDLDEVRARNEAYEQVSANYAPDSVVKGEVFRKYLVEDSEYTVMVAVRSYEIVHNVRLSTLMANGENMDDDQLLDTFTEFMPGDIYLIGLTFPGDMTSYCLSYVDVSGVTHYFSISISGRNGSLVFGEFQPNVM